MKMFQTTNQMISTTQISISVVQHTQCDTLREWCVNNENTDKNHQTAVWGSLGRSSTQSGCSIFLKFHSKIPVSRPSNTRASWRREKTIPFSLLKISERFTVPVKSWAMWLDAWWAWGTLSVWPRTTQQGLWPSVLHLSPSNGFPVFPGSPASPSAPGPRSNSSTRYRPVALGQLISPSSQQLRVQLPNQAHPKSPMVEGHFSFQTHRITDSEWCLNIDHPFLGSFRCPTWDCLKHLGKKSKKISG